MKTAFLSYKFGGKGEALANSLGTRLRELSIRSVTGKRPDPSEPISQEIIALIRHTDLLISIRCEGEDSSYVDHEAGIALGASIPVIVVCTGNVLREGILHDRRWILLSQDPLEAVRELDEYLRGFAADGGIGRVPEYIPAAHSPKSEVDGEGWAPEVRRKLAEMKEHADRRDYARALEVALGLRESDPDCWRAYIACWYCSHEIARMNGNPIGPEQEDYLDEVLARFPGNGRARVRALGNKAAVRQTLLALEKDPKKCIELKEERVLYCREALKCEWRPLAVLNLTHSLVALGLEDEAVETLTGLLRENEARNHIQDFITRIGAKGVSELTKSPRIAKLIWGDSQEEGERQ